MRAADFARRCIAALSVLVLSSTLGPAHAAETAVTEATEAQIEHEADQASGEPAADEDSIESAAGEKSEHAGNHSDQQAGPEHKDDKESSQP